MRTVKFDPMLYFWGFVSIGVGAVLGVFVVLTGCSPSPGVIRDATPDDPGDVREWFSENLHYWPLGVSNFVNKGYGWVTWELEGHRFLAYHGTCYYRGVREIDHMVLVPFDGGVQLEDDIRRPGQ